PGAPRRPRYGGSSRRYPRPRAPRRRCDDDCARRYPRPRWPRRRHGGSRGWGRLGVLLDRVRLGVGDGADLGVELLLAQTDALTGSDLLLRDDLLLGD